MPETFVLAALAFEQINTAELSDRGVEFQWDVCVADARIIERDVDEELEEYPE